MDTNAGIHSNDCWKDEKMKKAAKITFSIFFVRSFLAFRNQNKFVYRIVISKAQESYFRVRGFYRGFLYAELKFSEPGAFRHQHLGPTGGSLTMPWTVLLGWLMLSMKTSS